MTTAEDARSQVDLLIANIDWVLTLDPDRNVIRNGSIAVDDGRIVGVGSAQEMAMAWQPSRTIDGRGRVATPGFVDNHLHASFQLSRGLADEVNAQAFLFERMYPYEGAMTEQDVYISSLLAGWELLSHGVTTFIDPGNYHPEQTVRACKELGIRVIVARSTFDKSGSVLGLLPESMIDTTDEALAAAEAVLEEFGGPIDQGWSASASFRGMNNSSDELIRGLHALAQKHDTFLQTHACFSYSTHDASVAQCGQTEIARLESLGVLDERMLLVHGGWLEPADIAHLIKHQPTVVHAPSSSVHNGYGNLEVGFIPELLELGVNVSLGSDHASSGSVDMCNEMYLAACGHKETRLNPRVMPPEQVLEMATTNGAQGTGFGERLGSIEPDKLADIVLFDATQPEWLPLYNPVSNLVYSAPGSTVDTVIVGGKAVVEGGHLATVDEDRIRGLVQTASDEVLQRLDPERVISLKWPVTNHSLPVTTEDN